ncbi:MAG: hypothetical protein K8S87_07350 [Planctomycetes bacterium]|nr:hypothetical protein [Planctomycetota bacterium]
MSNKRKLKSSQIGFDNMYKPVTAEYVGCFIVLVPLFIFLLFCVFYMLMRYYGYTSGWEMLSDFWDNLFS